MRAGAALAVALLLGGCAQEPDYDGRFCTEDSPCPNGFSCSGGTCHRLCAINDECVLSEQVCVSGVCTSLTTAPMDAGVQHKDAGGAPDAEAFVECLVDGECGAPGACEIQAGASCVEGRCVYERVRCGDPPPAECTDGDTLFRTYSQFGSCDDATGDCEYTAMGVPCADCSASCLEPCAAVACDEDHGGCRTGGYCMPGVPGDPPTCVYDDADDGTDCTKDDGQPGRCHQGDCAECNEAADCDDGNPCTSDVCDTAAGTCSHVASAGACNDGNACTRTDVCMGGACVGMDPTDCSSGGPECRQPAGTCNPATGACEYPPSTLGTVCTADGNPCSDDVCDGAGGCIHPNRPNGSACTDSSACTQTDVCQNGACVGSNPVACNTPPGQCYETAGSCNPSDASCTYSPSPTTRACNDANTCTHTDRCNGVGGCSGTAYSCNDANACTSDTCDGNGGCSYSAVAPPGLNPSGGAVVSTMDVTLTWTGCGGGVTYEVDIDWLRSDGTWADYFVYTGEPNNSKTFFPCSSAAPGLPCNDDFRFRVRSYNGTTFGPWSTFVIWHWNNCRTC